MAKKEDKLFGKLNMKDYNNYLEEILEKKMFSSDTKNFLLSMLYKIENSYNDYATVKVLVKSKSQFIEEILEIIKNDCDEIKLVKPLDKGFATLNKLSQKCIVDREKRSITCIYNEQWLLHALYKLKVDLYEFPNHPVGKAMREFFECGCLNNSKEVIRDFDGWAWNSNESEIDNLECNLVFQNILLLIGDDFKSEKDLKERFNDIDKRTSNDIYKNISKIAVIFYLEKHSKEISEFKEYRDKLKKKYTKMQNKEEYLLELTKKIERLKKKIVVIDNCFSNTDILKKELIKYNKNVQNKISVKVFIEKIELEKKKINVEIQQLNLKMLPKIYLQEKENLVEQIEILEVLKNKNELKNLVLELQRYFLMCLKQKINNADTRIEIMNIIFILRYYLLIPSVSKMKDNNLNFSNEIESIQSLAYDKAYEMNAMNQISVNKKTNYEVLNTILDTRIIELKDIEILFVAENYQIVLKIFDEDSIEKIVEYDTIEGLIAKRNKKFRLFIK